MNVSEFRPTNKETAIGCIICVVVLVVVYCIMSRTEPSHDDTNRTVEQLEKRIESVEQRVDSVSARLDQAEKTNTELGGRIESSTILAKEIGNGIERVQDGLDSAIQRSGRITNLIADIEAKNK